MRGELRKRVPALVVKSLPRETVLEKASCWGVAKLVRQRTLDPSSGGSNPPAPVHSELGIR